MSELKQAVLSLAILIIFSVAIMYGLFNFFSYQGVYVQSSPVPPPVDILNQSNAVLSGEEFLTTEKGFTGDLLPDLVPLPPNDLVVEESDWGATILRFSTTYFNQGDGHLELKPDPETAGIKEDIERDIYQIIYNTDGSTREKVVGNFLWHQEHLHYHYADFIEYDLESLGEPDREDLEGKRVKSTFCIRDVSRVFLDLPNVVEDALFTICGKELQGVSVGWGDTYYFNYPDQSLVVDGLPSGVYKLTFNVNPASLMEELRYDNNIASATFYMDQENYEVSILETFPEESPEFEYVHLDDPFGGVEE